MGAAPIGPGDWIECIGDWPRIGLTRGSVWLCESTYAKPADVRCAECAFDARVGLQLRGKPVPSGNVGWCPCGFRPIYRTDETLTARLLSDIPADAPASPEEVVA